MKMKTHFSLDAIQPEGNGKASSMLPSAAHILKKKKKKHLPVLKEKSGGSRVQR